MGVCRSPRTLSPEDPGRFTRIRPREVLRATAPVLDPTSDRGGLRRDKGITLGTLRQEIAESPGAIRHDAPDEEIDMNDQGRP